MPVEHLPDKKLPANRQPYEIQPVNNWRSNLSAHKRSWLAFTAALAIIALLQWLTNDHQSAAESDLTQATILNASDTAKHASLAAAANAPVPTVGSIHVLPDKLKLYAEQEKFDLLRTELMQQAMLAVEQQSDKDLANAMALLGLAALEEEDIDTALVYLNESLELYDDIEFELGVASVSLHIGRLHIVERRRARRAALAYDTSLLARWKIAHGYFDEAESELKNAIDENLTLNRNGAAAVDFETLYRGYVKSGNVFEAEAAAIATARLHAGSGRLQAAEKLLNELQENSLLTIDIADVKSELAVLNTDYEDSVLMLGRARDYNQLYNHYIAENDPVRAWRLRLKANAALQKANKRARYRRQSGVLVLLYNSNDSMQRARSSLERARTIFTAQNKTGLAYQSTLLMSEVY